MKSYINKLERGSVVEFIVALALLAFFIKIPMGIIGGVLLNIFHLDNPLFRAAMQEPTLTRDDLLLAIGFAPLLETIIGQMIPLHITKLIGLHRRWRILISAFAFMLFHWPVLEFFPSAFAVGVILAWGWESSKRRFGLMQALVTVTLIHSLHNALVALIAATL